VNATESEQVGQGETLVGVDRASGLEPGQLPLWTGASWIYNGRNSQVDPGFKPKAKLLGQCSHFRRVTRWLVTTK